MLNYTATADDNNNETLKDEIAAEILAASQNASEDVYSVVVLELEGNPGSNIICHYEILLNIQSDPNQFELDDLTLSDSNFFNNSVVKFEKGMILQNLVMTQSLHCVVYLVQICNFIW